MRPEATVTVRPARSRVVAALATSALGLTALVTTAPPAAAVSGPIACPSALPTPQAVDGLAGTGYTVERGTTPEPFTAEVLGRITDGIAPGVDLIIAELDSPALRRAGGVWQGMSGSPVYTSDGRLIGAVSYGLSLGPSRIAGLTPGSDMKALVADRATAAARPAQRVAVPDGQAVAGMSAAQASGGFGRLQVPLSLSGAGSPSAQRLVDRLSARVPSARVLTGGAPAPATSAAPSSITAGGNLAAALSTGDISFSGVGTTTLVCDGTVVGFGHPMLWQGVSAYTMHPATAVYVQEDPTLAPFKVANPGGVAGTVDRDRLTGIRGRFGVAPAGLVVKSVLTAPGGTTRTGTTRITDRTYAPDLAAIHTLVNAELALRASGGGSATTTLTVRGTRAGGVPFTLERRIAVADSWSVGFALADDVYATLTDLVSQPFERVRLSSIAIEGRVTSAVEQYRVTALRVKQGDRFVVPPREGSLVARAGRPLPVRLTLTPYQGVGGDRTVDLRVTPPAGAAGKTLGLEVEGGDEGRYGGEPFEQHDEASSLDEVLQRLASQDATSVSATLHRRSGPVAEDSVDVGTAVSPYRNGFGVRVVAP